MAENQNGNNGNGNGKYAASWASAFINVASTGVLLAVFVIWWSVANPNPRMDKIESSITDVRQELIKGYLGLREHQEYQVQIARSFSAIDKRLEDFRVYAVNFYEKFEKLPESYVPRNESSKLFEVTQARIERLYEIMDDLSKRIDAHVRESVSTKDRSRLAPK